MTYSEKDKTAGAGDALKNSRRYTDKNAERRADAKRPSDPEQRHLDRQLDKALEETFPASDPVHLTPESQR